ncbi:MAG: DUF433 domain-containing protein [Cyanobacteria bacterium J06627_28]
MGLQELKRQAAALSIDERIDLMAAIVQSLKSHGVKEAWRFLEPRTDTWRKQLYFRGKRLRASSVYFEMLANKMTPEEAAEDWELSLEAVLEAVEYCEMHEELIAAEAQRERASLDGCDALLKPPTAATHS